MKDRIINGVIFCGYCIPYSFVAMNGDINSRTVLFYGIMLVCFGVLCVAASKRQIIRYAVAGNVLSASTSYICVCSFATDEWLWYFKPLTPKVLSILISTAAFIIQLVIWCIIRKKYTATQRKAAG